MNPSERIKAKIMLWEGCRYTAYLCPAGVLTIGYGHTGPDVYDGRTVTPAEAAAIFSADIEKFAIMVESALGSTRLNNDQFDACVSLAFNIGMGNFQASTLLKKIKANAADPAIANEFKRWNKSNGRELPGLTRRRQEEANIYFGKWSS